MKDLAPEPSPSSSDTEAGLAGVVVLHIAEDGSYDMKVWGAERVCVLWIDERAPGDRVYRYDSRESERETLKALIGADRIGHAGDDHLDEQTVQAIRAMCWRMQGGRLAEVQGDGSGTQNP